MFWPLLKCCGYSDKYAPISPVAKLVFICVGQADLRIKSAEGFLAAIMKSE